MNIISGNPQSVTISTAFAPLVVQVVDSGGNPVPGVDVNFTPNGVTANAAVAVSPVTTDGTGQATANATANTVTGSYTVSASVAGVATPADFNLTNLAGAPASVSIVSGDGQSVAINTAFLPLVVEVRDASNNLVPGASVTFTAQGVTANAVITGSPATTDALGQATVTAVANSTAGSYTVLADVGGLTVTFNLSNLPGGPASIWIISGEPQAVTVNSPFLPLVVEVRDSGGNPVPGVSVNFTPNGTTANALIAMSPIVTAGNGQAVATATANTVAGSYTVTADAGGGLTATFNLTNNSGPLNSFTIVLGDGQSTTITMPFALPLVVQALDVYTNPIPNLPISFTANGATANATLSAASVNTGANGQASVGATANNLVGSFTVTADAGGGNTLTFNLTNLTSGPDHMNIVSGSPQSVTINTAFAPLIIEVLDVGNNPISGVSVTFTAPGSGASAAIVGSPANTDALGQVTVNATANSTAGSYSVTADAGSGITQTFSLTNTVGALDHMVIVSGDGQSAVVGQPFATPLVVQALDIGNNPISGVAVTYTANGATANATLTGSPATTDGTGQASVTATANATSGGYTVTADAGGGITQTFNLNNTPIVAGSITCVAGSGQSAQVGAAFTNPLVVEVLNNLGNPMAGQTVTLGGVIVK